MIFNTGRLRQDSEGSFECSYTLINTLEVEQTSMEQANRKHEMGVVIVTIEFKQNLYYGITVRLAKAYTQHAQPLFRRSFPDVNQYN